MQRGLEVELEMLTHYRHFDDVVHMTVCYVDGPCKDGLNRLLGLSFYPSSTEQDPMDFEEMERRIRLLQAAWFYFDAVADRVSAQMRKGPRGGGRDRDQIVRHVIRNESEDFAKKVGIRIPEEAALTSAGLHQHRQDYVAAMRAYNAGKGKPMRSWTLPFLIRHSAIHVLDQAWEMEDKDLTESRRRRSQSFWLRRDQRVRRTKARISEPRRSRHICAHLTVPGRRYGATASERP
jgi:hypothetical protein